MKCRNEGQRPWTYRRTRDSLLLAACVAWISWIMLFGANTEKYGEVILSSSFLLIAALCGLYGILAHREDTKPKDPPG